MINYVFIIIFVLIAVFKIFDLINGRMHVQNQQSLTAGVIHDLKSPIRAQINILNMLINNEFGVLTPKQSEMLKLTFGATKYMSNLINSILAKYEYDNSAIKLNITGCNLTEIINSVCLSNECLANEREQKIIFDCKGTAYYVYCDRLQIERVISNLITNAIVHGFKSSTIRVFLNQEGENINFRVENRSYPISERDLKCIFDKFSHSKSCPTGEGLGLYVSKRIIKLHGGKIFAKSSPNGLCVFGFTLPSKEHQYAPLSV